MSSATCLSEDISSTHKTAVAVLDQATALSSHTCLMLLSSHICLMSECQSLSKRLCHAGSHDKDTLLAATIAEFLYPAAQQRLDGEPYNAFVARIKALFHKEVLAPLRRCLDVPEVPLLFNV